MAFRPHDVHSHQHFGPILAFSTAGAGVNFQNGAELIFFVAEHALEFQRFNRCGYGFEFCFNFFRRAFAFFKEFVKRFKIAEFGFYGLKIVGPDLNRFYFA